MLEPKPTFATIVKSADAAQIGLELGRKKKSIVATLPMAAKEIKRVFRVRAARRRDQRGSQGSGGRTYLGRRRCPS